MELAYGNDQVGLAGRPLAQHIKVKVTDESSTPLRGVSVSLAVTSGGGSVDTPTGVTDTEGFAGAAWTLGSGPNIGAQLATATIDGTAIVPVTFSAHVVTEVVKGGGDGQTAEVGERVAEAPTVIIRDATDQPVSGVTVLWTVNSGGGWVDSPSSVTDASGVASMPWTLGLRVGAVHSLKASIAPEFEAAFSATGVLTVGVFEVDGGNDRSGVAGTTLGIPLAVWVGPPYVDALYGTYTVQGVEVVWEVVGGGGSLSTGTSFTDPSSRARVRWTLGSTPGTNNQVVRASVAGFSGSPVTFTASATAAP
jgi:hypothetical protein